MKTYRAPWSAKLIVMSVVASLLCVGIAFGMPWNSEIKRGLLLALVPVSALFSIRGYAITPDHILVQRLLWTTRLLRSGLQSARFEPEAMRGSLRAFGNGGFFSFTGWYRNKRLGDYRAFVTDTQHCVVLKFAGRTVVISPGTPEDFVRELALP